MERFLNILAAACGLFFALFALIVLATFAQRAHAAVEPDLKQETIGYCTARANLSLSIVKAMEDGTPIENINIAFQQPPASAEMEQARDDWIAALKVEISAAIVAIPRDKEDWAQRVAQKIIEKCWYDYGKKRVEKQTAAPADFIHAASSQAIADPKSARAEECSNALGDQILIGNMLGSGKGTVEDLKNMAQASSQELGQERYEKIISLINDAALALEKGALQAWFDDYWHACMDGGS